MKNTRIAIAALAVLTFATSTAYADAKSKEEKLRKLATLGGMTTQLDEAMGQILAQGRRTEQDAMAQVNAHLDVPPPFQPKFDEANKRFMAALQPKWTTFEVIDVFVRAYSPMVSEEDVDAALAYVTSGAGTRNAAAQAEAASQIGSFIAARSGDQTQKAMQAYVTEIRGLIRDCNCAKKAPAPPK